MTDMLTIKNAGDISDPAADPPAALFDVDVYNQFFNNPEKYNKYHVHLVGARARPGAVAPGCKAINSSCFNLFTTVATPDPMAVVETIGVDTGSTNYFPIGKHNYGVQKNSEIPVWDTRSIILGNDNVRGIKMTIYDSKEEQSAILIKTVIPHNDLPEAGTGWKEFVMTEESDSFEGMELIIKVKVTKGLTKIVSKEDLSSFLRNSDKLTYTEEVIEAKEDVNKAIVQCWRHRQPTNKAVLWVMGRNDCFMHPHVAEALFTGRGYDLYVLNYSCDGICRKRGWVSPNFNSHNPVGNFGIYVNQVAKAIEIMSAQNYETKIGYAHSTGGPVLIKYLMERGDDFFTSFIFNSPFLDWGHCGGDLCEFILENGFDKAKFLGIVDLTFSMNGAATPEEWKEPIKCMGDEIVLNAWSAKLWSQYFFDFRSRPLHTVPLTIGFVNGVTGVHEQIARWQKRKKYVTLKPMLCITSRGDDTLESSETLTKIDAIGPNRSEVELHHNAHDIFLSAERSDVQLAFSMVEAWMVSEGL